MADYDEIFLDADDRMQKAVEHLQTGFRTIRTGRASPALVEGLRVEAYGSMEPLKNVANIAAPEARQLVIKPFDPSVLAEIEKAIQKSELGINPSNDGKLIRLEIPALTEDRRKQIVKQIKEQAEAAKVSINNVRRDANKASDTAVDGGMSEDEGKRLKKDIDELKDKFQKQIESAVERKSTEIMEV